MKNLDCNQIKIEFGLWSNYEFYQLRNNKRS